MRGHAGLRGRDGQALEVRLPERSHRFANRGARRLGTLLKSACPIVMYQEAPLGAHQIAIARRTSGIENSFKHRSVLEIELPFPAKAILRKHSVILAAAPESNRSHAFFLSFNQHPAENFPADLCSVISIL